MASRFQLKRWRDVPAFLVAALRIRSQMLQSPGVIGVSLVAQPLRRTFYTLSAWRDRPGLDSAVAGQPHAVAMIEFRTKMADAVFAFWHRGDGLAPASPETIARLHDAARTI